jgi:hypothetical protein
MNLNFESLNVIVFFGKPTYARAKKKYTSMKKNI